MSLEKTSVLLIESISVVEAKDEADENPFGLDCCQTEQLLVSVLGATGIQGTDAMILYLEMMKIEIRTRMILLIYDDNSW